jgi:Fe-S cluster assembly iron-binding protein IscA
VRSNAQGLALRVAARQVADGSIEYGMGFDDTREDDEPAQFGELTVLVGSPSKPLLQGTVLDYVEIEPGRFEFIFAPPAPGSATRRLRQRWLRKLRRMSGQPFQEQAMNPYVDLPAMLAACRGLRHGVPGGRRPRRP